MSLHSRHAIVTGASRGIGAAIATRLSGMGADLTLIGRDGEALERLAATLGRAQAEVCDVTDADRIAGLFARLCARAPVAVLVNNAGAAESAPFLKTTDAIFERMIGLNLMAAVRCTRAVLPSMIGAGWGRVINVASTAGLKAYPYVSAYVAAKHALVGVTRALALELAREPVTVNAVCPGYTDTDLVRDAVVRIVARTGRSEAETRDALVAGNPQHRLIRPEEVADAVAWLCGPESASITGQAIAVAGGEVM
jgi:NAD(P)-dependent dehydrogenase (short-subunit alcohol dehydrogenase family)